MFCECVPFLRIPHTSSLFLDSLHDYPKVNRFFPRPPNWSEWLPEQVRSIRYDESRRTRVADVLSEQNRRLGSSPATMDAIERFRSGGMVVVTGQQVGLFGGPLYSLLKAVSALKLASEMTAAGVPTVPVFWLATEDHDLAEVNHVDILGPEGGLRTLLTTSRGVADAPVGQVRLGDEITQVANEAAELLGENEVAQAIRESYRAGETMGTAFGKLFARLFRDRGLILLDANDPEVHRIGAPIYRSAVEHSDEIRGALVERGKELDSAGYHQQVKVTETAALLFAKPEGHRTPLQRTRDGFAFGDQKFSTAELLKKIEEQPEYFSPNVLLRPVMQDYLLPTVAYIGGAAEVAYFAQAAVVYENILGRVTPVLPRFSATLVEPRAKRLLEKYDLHVTDVFLGPERLRELLGERSLPADLHNAFNEAASSLEQSMTRVRSALEQLDPTLVEAAKGAESKMQYQLSRLRSRSAESELRRQEVVARHAETLSASLYPNKTLQEREIAGVYFLAKQGTKLLDALYESAQTGCPDHKVLFLD